MPQMGPLMWNLYFLLLIYLVMGVIFLNFVYNMENYKGELFEFKMMNLFLW